MISLSEAKAFMGVTSSTDDTLIGTLIDYAEGLIENYIDNKIDQVSISNEILEIVDRFDLQYIPSFDLAPKYKYARTLYYPIASLSITQDGTTLTSGTDYTYEANTGVITFYTNVSDYQQGLKANYTAGYSTCPNDIKLVALELTKALYQNAGATAKGYGSVSNKKIGDFSVSYKSTNVDITAWSGVLDKYRGISL
ncbi:MAG TPA: head-tail connector protein [Paludibacteraceae bacterium]|nr:head-tail connector protein [Paludibacteraceae bacterium]